MYKLLIYFVCMFLPAVIVSAKDFLPAKDYLEDKPNFIRYHLNKKSYNIDTSASAIVLYENFTYEYTDPSIPFQTYKVRKIIKILKPEGIRKGDIEILAGNSKHYYAKIKNITGVTYNLKGTQVTTDKLDAENISKSTYANLKEKKFSMPAVHEGSVIDVSYEIERTPTFEFAEWDIQEDIPKLRSELVIEQFKLLHVVGLSLHQPMFVYVGDKIDMANDSLLPNAMENGDYGKNITSRKWVRKNIPALQDEPFVDNIYNYSQNTKYYIDHFVFRDSDNQYVPKWDEVNEFLLNEDDFGKAPEKNKKFMKERGDEIVKNESRELEKSKLIFKYVRDSVTNNKEGGLLLSQSLKQVYESHNGSATEINMLLIALLKAQGIDADPVIISTKDNGSVLEKYPSAMWFNLAIAEVVIGGVKYELDASDKYCSFGKLPEQCLNSYARKVNKKGEEAVIDFSKFRRSVSVMCNSSYDEKGNYIVNLKYFFSDLTAIKYRHTWKEDSDDIKKQVTDIVKKLPYANSRLQKYIVQNLDDPDKNLVLDINVLVDWSGEGTVLYLPLFADKFFDQNPFIQKERNLPVELPACYSYNYVSNFQVPKGYMLDEMPHSLKVEYNDTVQFRYQSAYDTAANVIQVASQSKVSKTFFPLAEYPSLKDFFEKMVAEEQKTIVLKKKN